MNWRPAKRGLQWIVLSLFCIPSLAQDSSVKPIEPVQLKNDPASDVGLALVSAERVYLASQALETKNDVDLGRHGSGRVPPNADKARARLAELISDWHRFTIVDAPADSDLILTITETNRASGWKAGVLVEKLKVAKGGPDFANSRTLWEGRAQEGGVTHYRPIDKSVKEFRSALEDNEKKFPPEKIAQTREARKPAQPSGGCAAEKTKGEESNNLEDCLSHSISELFLPDDREENGGPVRLAQAVLIVNPLDMLSRISTKEFSDYVVAMQQALHKQLKPEQPQAGWDLAVLGTFQAQGKATIHLQSRASPDRKYLQTFYDNLQNLAAPSVNGDPLEFRVVFTIWGGSEESKKEH